MKMRLTLLLALFVSAVYVAAQEPTPPPNLVDVGAKAIVALTPILSVLVLWGLKALWAQVPASLILFAAPVVGWGIDFFLSWLTDHPSSNPLVSAGLGALAVYLREFAATVLSKGFTGPVAATKAMF